MMTGGTTALIAETYLTYRVIFVIISARELVMSAVAVQLLSMELSRNEAEA